MLIQAITNQSNYKIQFPRFTGSPRVATKPIQAAADTFVKSAETPVFGTIRDILNYLKKNADKVKDGEIFNTPITKDGDSLLMAFLHIKPIEEEEEAYESLLYKMEKMPKINYDQKDSMDMTSLEWMMSAENFALLDLMKGKKLTQDPMTHTTYKHIKNPEFRKALVESGVYKSMFETLKETMKEYSSHNFLICERIERYRVLDDCGCHWRERTLAPYEYKQQEIEMLKDLFTYFEYGKENFKEDKQKFLAAIRPFVSNFLGSFKHSDTVRKSEGNREQMVKNVMNLYYITGCNKELFRDIIVDGYSNEVLNLYDERVYYTIEKIFEDFPKDLDKIHKYTKLPVGEGSAENLLKVLNKENYKELKNEIDTKIYQMENRFSKADKHTTLEYITDYLSKNKSKINDGEIFNLPMPDTGLTPLVALTKVVLNEGEEQDLQILFKEMKNMPKIDFNQKDAANGLYFIENVFLNECDFILPIIPKNLEYNYKFEAAFDGIKNKDFKNKVRKLYLFQNNSKNADWIGQSAYFNSKLLKSPNIKFTLPDYWNDIGKYAVENDVEGIRSVAESGFDINTICKDGHNWGPHFFYSSSIYSIADYYGNNDVINYLKKFPHLNDTNKEKIDYYKNHFKTIDS